MLRHLQFSIVWLIVICMAVVMGGCDKDEESSVLKISKTEIEVGCDGETLQIEVTGNVRWSAASTVSWLTVTPAYGSGDGTLEIRILPNEGAQREGGNQSFQK